jgi:hypothetical protein
MKLNFLKKRYRIVAYNNRMYEGWKFVDNVQYTMYGAKSWIDTHGDRDRYLYDLYDIAENELVYNYESMIKDFKAVKKVIARNDINVYDHNVHFNDYHSEALKKYIFNFKEKWNIKFGIKAPQIYFEDLMTLYNLKTEKYHEAATYE